MPDLEVIGLVRRPVQNSDLGYSTVDVTFAYLAAIYKVVPFLATYTDHIAELVNDIFTDKAIEGWGRDGTRWQARINKTGNGYSFEIVTAISARDFLIVRWSSGSSTQIGYEAVDLSDKWYLLKMSVGGSTLKWYRDDLTTPKVTVTDTTYASGYFGVGVTTGTSSMLSVVALSSILRAPSSSLPQPSAIVEYPVVGSGKPEDPIRPDMPQELVEVDPGTLPPEEAQAVLFNPKGPNGLPQVDRLAVTWGAIDYKGEPTMITAIYGGSPSYLRPDRIQRHMEHARRKNLLAETIKPDPAYVRDLHRRLAKDRKDMLITENELMYQLLGYEELEVDAVADFYERELVNLKRIKDVPGWALERTLEIWERLAEKYKRSNALVKLRRVRRR